MAEPLTAEREREIRADVASWEPTWVSCDFPTDDVRALLAEIDRLRARCAELEAAVETVFDALAELDRLTAERDAAQAEAARLRGVETIARAIVSAERVYTCDCDDPDPNECPFFENIPAGVVEQLKDALASVPDGAITLTDNQAEVVRQALALYRSIVRSGESETETAKVVMDEALALLARKRGGQ